MINPSFKELEKISKSRYSIVIMASKRARRIVDGSKPLCDTAACKPVTIAIDEIMNGKLKYEMPDVKSIK